MLSSRIKVFIFAETLDFSRLSLHEAKKEEMESQVRMLELEAELTKERARFAQLRKQHYHLASLVANENGSASSRVRNAFLASQYCNLLNADCVWS